MTFKEFKTGMVLFAVLLWIPLGIAAFYFSPARIDIKLLVAAGASFIAMIILFIKEN